MIYFGDCRVVLPRINSSSCRVCVTSPPYWGLRQNTTDGVGEIGAEETLDGYVANLVGVFREVRRILSDDGTLWLNIGDAYTSGNRTWRQADPKNAQRAMSRRPKTPAGMKPKDLIGLPWLVAFALRIDGWFLRSEIVWEKPDAQPESVSDRPTRSHETVFLLSKSKQYFYASHLSSEPGVVAGDRRLRSVWRIATDRRGGANGAGFPRELARRCITLGSMRGDRVLDPFLGGGTVEEVARKEGRTLDGVYFDRESKASSR